MRFIASANAPLSPDPFFLEASQPLDRGFPFPLSPLHPSLVDYPRYAFHPSAALYRPIESSLAIIAFIPKGHLHLPYSVFADDRVTSQHRWLSRAYMDNRLRVIHGLRVMAHADQNYGFAKEPPHGRLLAKGNPTTIRIFPFIRFDPPIQASGYPAGRRVPPPAPRANQEIVAVGADLRAMNGFFASSVGKLLWHLQRRLAPLFGGKTPDYIPQIGTSLQLWLAQDGCKCFAFAHNYFPKYECYLDGVQMDWDSLENFDDFDGYDIDVEWQPYVAFLLYDALRSYPLKERYPGACGVGWYRSISEDGKIEWCEKAPRAHVIRFRDAATISQREIEEWWRSLERYVSRFIEINAEYQKNNRSREILSWWSDNREVRELWRGLQIHSWRAAHLTDQEDR